MGTVAFIGAVLVASAWHPLRANSRSAAESAGLRLVATFILLVVLVFVPPMFDRGVGSGQDTSTCPGFINSHSSAWWASLVVLGLVWWSAIGVMKATGVSIHRGERHAVAVLAATCLAVGLAGAGLFAVAFSSICA